jgi:tight adherence protein B
MVGFATYLLTSIAGLAICLSLLTLAICVEVLRVLANSRQRSFLACWPQVFEILQTGVLSGVSTIEQFEYLAKSGPKPLRLEFGFAHEQLERGTPMPWVFGKLRERFSNRYGDLLALLFELENELGSNSMASTFQQVATQVRREQGELSALEAKQGWVSSSAKVALLSPWLVALMLIQLPQNKQAFATELGSIVLVTGLLLSLVAYALVNRLGALPTAERVLNGH